MEDCIFCKIAAGEVPKRKIHHEDGEIVSFLDLDQRIPGHTLVIPTSHHRWFYDIPDELSNKLYRAARVVAQELKKEYGADYVQLSIVGEGVAHVHVHLLPRKLSDSVSL